MTLGHDMQESNEDGRGKLGQPLATAPRAFSLLAMAFKCGP